MITTNLLPVAELAFNSKFALAIGGFGAALGVGIIGGKASEAIGRNPGAFGKIFGFAIVAMAFAEAIAFYMFLFGN